VTAGRRLVAQLVLLSPQALAVITSLSQNGDALNGARLSAKGRGRFHVLAAESRDIDPIEGGPASVSRMSPGRWEKPGEGWGSMGNRIEDSSSGNDG